METIEIPVIKDRITGIKMFEINRADIERFKQVLDENRAELSPEQIEKEEKLIKKFERDINRAGNYNFVQYWLSGELKG